MKKYFTLFAVVSLIAIPTAPVFANDGQHNNTRIAKGQKSYQQKYSLGQTQTNIQENDDKKMSNIEPAAGPATELNQKTQINTPKSPNIQSLRLPRK